MGGFGAARLGDKVAHGGGGAGAAATAGGTGSASSGGGDVLEGSANVVIEHQPAARAGMDHATCDHGHPPTLIAEGSSTVFVNGRPLGRLGDPAQCAAHLRSSATTVIVGGGTTSAADLAAADTQRAPAFMLVDFPGVAGAPQAAVAGGRGAGAPPAAAPPPNGGVAAAAAHGGHAPPVTNPPKRPALQGRAASSPNRYVRAAGAYEGTPYDIHWRTDGDASDGSQGIDCSGLVGHVYGLNEANGVPMTTGEINDTLSQPGSGFTRLPPGSTPQAGDVLMWPGHTGIAVDPTTLVHAPQTGYAVEENVTGWVRPDAPTIFRPDPSVYPP